MEFQPKYIYHVPPKFLPHRQLYNPNVFLRSGFHGFQITGPAGPKMSVLAKTRINFWSAVPLRTSIGGGFLVLVGGRFPWLWIWGGWSKSRDRSGLLCHTTFDHSNMVKNLGQRSNNQILSKLFTAVLCMRKCLRIHDRSRFIIRVNIFFMWCVLRIWPHSEINCHVLVSRVTILCHRWHDDPVAHSQLCHPSAYLFIFRFLKTICLHIFPNNESSFYRITKWFLKNRTYEIFR